MSPEAPRLAPEVPPQDVIRWVENELDLLPGAFGPASAVAVRIGDKLAAGIVLSNYEVLKGGNTIQASIVATTPRWATRSVLAELFEWPFRRLGVTRLWVGQPRQKRLRRFAERLGFVYEGVARRALDGERDMVVFSMMPHECPWLKVEHPNGQGQSAEAA